jgi:hypothetical protein
MFCTATTSVYHIFTAYNKLRFVSITHIVFGFINALVVFVLVNITDWGIFAVAGVSSFISIFKIFLFIFPYAAKCVGKKPTFFIWPSLKSFLSIVGVALTGYVLKMFFVINNWFSLAVFGILLAVLAFGFNLCVNFRKDERIVFVKSVINVLLRR